MSKDTEAITVLIEPIVRAADFDLEDITVHRSGDRSVVRVTVDTDKGSGLDVLADLSREVSEVLDAAEPPVLGALRYTLEVTSPGVDRPLTRPRHWRRAHGRKVIVITTGSQGAQSGSAPETVAGRVGRFDEETGVVDVVVTHRGRSDLRRVATTDIASAVVQVDFGRPTRDERHLCGLPETDEAAAPVAVWTDADDGAAPDETEIDQADAGRSTPDVRAPRATRGRA